MDYDKIDAWITTAIAVIGILLPAVIKAFHIAGYEVPLLTRMSDAVANRPKVFVRRAKRLYRRK